MAQLGLWKSGWQKNIGSNVLEYCTCNRTRTGHKKDTYIQRIHVQKKRDKETLQNAWRLWAIYFP